MSEHPDKYALIAHLSIKRVAEKRISEILQRHPHSNKTTAMNIILGKCAQCGGEKDDDSKYYCAGCRKKMAAWAKARTGNAKPANQEPYNNDEH